MLLLEIPTAFDPATFGVYRGMNGTFKLSVVDFFWDPVVELKFY